MLCKIARSNPTGQTTADSGDGSDSDEPPDGTYFGTGPYTNLWKEIILKESNTAGLGLYTTSDVKKGTLMWKDREDGPSKTYYHKIQIDKLNELPETERNIAIKYGYQIDDNTFLTPLTQ